MGRFDVSDLSPDDERRLREQKMRELNRQRAEYGAGQVATDSGPKLARAEPDHRTKAGPGEVILALTRLQDAVLQLRDQIDGLREQLGPVLIPLDRMPPEVAPSYVEPPDPATTLGLELAVKTRALVELTELLRMTRQRLAL